LRPAGWELRQYDPDLSLDTFLWMLFERYGINCVLDVGARHGDYGILLRNNNYRGAIASFEPVSASYQILRSASAGDPTWTTYPFALGSSAGTAEINVGTGTSYSSFLSPSAYGLETNPDIAAERTETVQIRTLDEVFAEATGMLTEPRVYLKMDTQGFDLEVIRGAKACLPQIVALQSELTLQPLYEEMSTSWVSALEEFRGAGFELSAMFAGYRDPQLRLSEMDCVMVRSDR
jgi:FkbM family methyltransferase